MVAYASQPVSRCGLLAVIRPAVELELAAEVDREGLLQLRNLLGVLGLPPVGREDHRAVVAAGIDDLGEPSHQDTRDLQAVAACQLLVQVDVRLADVPPHDRQDLLDALPLLGVQLVEVVDARRDVAVLLVEQQRRPVVIADANIKDAVDVHEDHGLGRRRPADCNVRRRKRHMDEAGAARQWSPRWRRGSRRGGQQVARRAASNWRRVARNFLI
mmetsp:Transcript_98111/g.283032  ORF Transcript_98111/g.283032 Transcript_98111/m.283032 type:complete len:215 (+) Transcript_98111:538-1182(+)